MTDRTTPVTDFLLDRPGPESAKLAAIVASAVAHNIRFTVSPEEKDLIDEAMLAVDAVPVEFVPISPFAYALVARPDLREPINSRAS